jgi:hypothetical protein
MKLSRNMVISFVLLVIIAALYRVMPGRPLGFAPQIAMALFAGSVIKDRKYAFALPLLSMFISDLVYQFSYITGGGVYPGFYEGQLTNYVLFGLLTVVGFFIKERKVLSILTGSLVAPTLYFLTSNFFVWLSGSGLQRPKTWEGLILCFNDALPFYRTSIAATLFFSAILFGSHFLLTKPSAVKQTA